MGMMHSPRILSGTALDAVQGHPGIAVTADMQRLRFCTARWRPVPSFPRRSLLTHRITNLLHVLRMVRMLLKSLLIIRVTKVIVVVATPNSRDTDGLMHHSTVHLVSRGVLVVVLALDRLLPLLQLLLMCLMLLTRIVVHMLRVWLWLVTTLCVEISVLLLQLLVLHHGRIATTRNGARVRRSVRLVIVVSSASASAPGRVRPR